MIEIKNEIIKNEQWDFTLGDERKGRKLGSGVGSGETGNGETHTGTGGGINGGSNNRINVIQWMVERGRGLRVKPTITKESAVEIPPQFTKVEVHSQQNLSDTGWEWWWE